MKTTYVKPSELKKDWILIDAANQPVGRIASEIARVLRGKHKPSFTPYHDCGDHVVVINAKDVVLTGAKWDDKVYYRHSNYIGGIKATVAKDMRDTYPERIIEKAVKGMLPRNKLGRKILSHLKVYGGSDHPHAAQQPVSAPLRLAKEG